jgi:hypothetical protein
MALAATHTATHTFGQVRRDLTGFGLESGSLLFHLAPKGLDFCLLGGNGRLIRLFSLRRTPNSALIIICLRTDVVVMKLLICKNLPADRGEFIAHQPPPMPPPDGAGGRRQTQVNDRANRYQEILPFSLGVTPVGPDFAPGNSGFSKVNSPVGQPGSGLIYTGDGKEKGVQCRRTAAGAMHRR